MAIIAATVAPTTSATTKHETPLPSLAAMAWRIPPLKWLHLPFFLGVSTYAEVPEIWGVVVVALT